MEYNKLFFIKRKNRLIYTELYTPNFYTSFDSIAYVTSIKDNLNYNVADIIRKNKNEFILRSCHNNKEIAVIRYISNFFKNIELILFNDSDELYNESYMSISPPNKNYNVVSSKNIIFKYNNNKIYASEKTDKNIFKINYNKPLNELISLSIFVVSSIR
jgi:hypothetical protein